MTIQSRFAKKTLSLTKAALCCLAVLVLTHQVCAQGGSEIVVPSYDDKYSKFVKQLEAGETEIDYKEFRESFLDSQQFAESGKKFKEFETLRKNLHELMEGSNYAEIIDVTKKMLSIDYTDMEAHKIQYQTYKLLGDSANSKKYQDIELGLLKSIVKNGNGQSNETAWPVIQVKEEYFILQMIGAEMRGQSLDPNGPCDKMEVEVKGEKRTYYFNISKVFYGYQKGGIK